MEQPGFTSCVVGTRENGALREDLLRAVRGEAAIPETCMTLSMYWHEQKQASAELFEREIWAANAIIDASAGIWDQLPQPTVVFARDGSKSTIDQLELGRFAHLRLLELPNEHELELIATDSVCWAHVTASLERESAGAVGALARSYSPVSTEDAVALIGLDRIVSQLEAVVGEAGRSLVAAARMHDERRARLERTERKLGWRQDPGTQSIEVLPWRTRFLIGLVGQEDRNWLAACAGIQGLFVVCLCFMLEVPLLLLALLPVFLSLLIWKSVGE